MGGYMKKKFDAVKMMRQIRDKMSKEFARKSYEEQKEWLKERAKAADKKKVSVR